MAIGGDKRFAAIVVLELAEQGLVRINRRGSIELVPLTPRAEHEAPRYRTEATAELSTELSPVAYDLYLGMVEDEDPEHPWTLNDVVTVIGSYCEQSERDLPTQGRFASYGTLGPAQWFAGAGTLLLLLSIRGWLTDPSFDLINFIFPIGCFVLVPLTGPFTRRLKGPRSIWAPSEYKALKAAAPKTMRAQRMLALAAWGTLPEGDRAPNRFEALEELDELPDAHCLPIYIPRESASPPL